MSENKKKTKTNSLMSVFIKSAKKLISGETIKAGFSSVQEEIQTLNSINSNLSEFFARSSRKFV